MLSLTELFDDLLETVRYEDYLEELAEEDTDDRLANIDELRNKLVTYEETADEPTLSGFLEEVALVADIDGVDNDDNKILLMTLHSAKGLEFKHVYLAGMEDGVFPSTMTIISDDGSEIEEERRLAYVGITRAMEKLTITAARSRMLRGETEHYPISRFVREIPDRLLGEKLTDRVRGIDDAPRIHQARPKAVTGTKPQAKPYILEAAQKAANMTGTVSADSGGALGYCIGDRVMHGKYGEGSVTDIKPGAKDYQVTVLFDTAGQKIMYAGFAKLKKV